MISSENLGTYLNDHLAGAAAGCELADKLRDQYSETPYGEFLAELSKDIHQDRATLADLMERLNIETSAGKQAAGWLSEKLTRVRFSEALTGSAGLKRLLEFETLSLGIEGKQAMWRALRQVSDQYPQLADTDLDALAKRAEEQRSQLEEHRVETATRALA